MPEYSIARMASYSASNEAIIVADAAAISCEWVKMGLKWGQNGVKIACNGLLGSLMRTTPRFVALSQLRAACPAGCPFEVVPDAQVVDPVFALAVIRFFQRDSVHLVSYRCGGKGSHFDGTEPDIADHGGFVLVSCRGEGVESRVKCP